MLRGQRLTTTETPTQNPVGHRENYDQETENTNSAHTIVLFRTRNRTERQKNWPLMEVRLDEKKHHIRTKMTRTQTRTDIPLRAQRIL